MGASVVRSNIHDYGHGMTGNRLCFLSSSMAMCMAGGSGGRDVSKGSRAPESFTIRRELPAIVGTFEKASKSGEARTGSRMSSRSGKSVEQMGQASGVESRWYKALFEENCLHLLALLRERPNLVKEGWEADSSRKVEGSWPNHWWPSKVSQWKGRTALHVGARRGCVELITVVFTIYNLRFQGECWDGSDSSLMDRYAGNRYIRYISDEDREHSVNMGGAETMTGSSTREVEDRHQGERPHKDRAKPDPRGVIDYWKRLVAARRLKRISTIPRVSVTAIDDIFYSKDGYYNLDAFAIAVLNGNLQVITLLAEVGFSYCKENRYNFSTVPIDPPHNHVFEMDRWWRSEELNENRSLLRRLTESAVAEIHEHFGLRLQEEYSKHLDFNFLPSDEFMFHFLVTVPCKNLGALDDETTFDPPIATMLDLVIKYFWEKINSESGECWRFLLQLQDGQGRTPAHAAVDEGRIFRILQIFDSPPNSDRRDRLRLFTAPTFQIEDDSDTHPSIDARPILNTEPDFNPPTDIDSLPSLETPTDVDTHLVIDTLSAVNARGDVDTHPDVDTLSGFEALSGVSLVQDPRTFDTHPDVKSVDFAPGFVGTSPHSYGSLDSEILAEVDYPPGSEAPPVELNQAAMEFALAKVLDGAGRTVVHRAFALNKQKSREDIAVALFGSDIYKRAMCSRDHKHSALGALLLRSGCSFNVDSLSRENSFQGSKLVQPNVRVYDWYTSSTDDVQAGVVLYTVPFYSPVIHQCEVLLDNLDEVPLNPIIIQRGSGGSEKIAFLGPLEFAVLVGNAPLTTKFLEARSRNRGWKRKKANISIEGFDEEEISYPHVLHIAAANGNYELLKLCLDEMLLYDCDPFVVDPQGNNALHYALEGRPPFRTHLLDYINCFHVIKSDPRLAKQSTLEDGLVGRVGCINLLLQTGFDMFKENKRREVPYPRGLLKTNRELLSTWYEKQTKEFSSIQNTMSIAANAISVTAALVATASYVGPLQPPLSYADNPSELRLEILWVRMFIVCDILSFYLAVAAIVCSLIPCLPVPQQAMIDELRRTRKMVSLAVAFLFPSVVLVCLAFGASSVAVINYSSSSVGKTLTLVSTFVGAVFFIVAAFFFLIRFLIVNYRGNSWVQFLYKQTSF